MTKSINYDLIDTIREESKAIHFQTPPGVFVPIMNAYPGSSCFSCHGRFFELAEGLDPDPVEISIRYEISTYSAQQPQIRVVPVSYRSGIQYWDHSWPIAAKTPAQNPQLMWQDLKPKWNSWWADPLNQDPSSGMFMTVEVSGDGYLYMARLNILIP